MKKKREGTSGIKDISKYPKSPYESLFFKSLNFVSLICLIICVTEIFHYVLLQKYSVSFLCFLCS